MSEELKCLSCQQKDQEIASLIADLNNLRHFCDSIFEIAKRNNGVLYFSQNDDTWEIAAVTDNNVPINGKKKEWNNE